MKRDESIIVSFQTDMAIVRVRVLRADAALETVYAIEHRYMNGSTRFRRTFRTSSFYHAMEQYIVNLKTETRFTKEALERKQHAERAKD